MQTTASAGQKMLIPTLNSSAHILPNRRFARPRTTAFARLGEYEVVPARDNQEGFSKNESVTLAEQTSVDAVNWHSVP